MTVLSAIPESDEQQDVTETIHYLYEDGKTGTTKTVTLSFDGKPNADGGYDWTPSSTEFSEYPINIPGYHIVSAAREDTGANVLNADKSGIQAISGITHSSKGIDVDVHLAPNDETQTVDEKVTYVYDDGSKPTTTRTVNELTFSHKWNETTKSFDAWTPANSQFNSVQLDVPAGYHVVSAKYGNADRRLAGFGLLAGSLTGMLGLAEMRKKKIGKSLK